MFTEHYVKKLRLETNTKKLTSNSFSTRRPLGPKRGSGAGIACRVNAKRNPDILKYSLLAESNFSMASIGQLWQSCSIFYFQLLISHGILKWEPIHQPVKRQKAGTRCERCQASQVFSLRCSRCQVYQVCQVFSLRYLECQEFCCGCHWVSSISVL